MTFHFASLTGSKFSPTAKTAIANLYPCHLLSKSYDVQIKSFVTVNDLEILSENRIIGKEAFGFISRKGFQRSRAKRGRGDHYQNGSFRSVWDGRSGSFRLGRGKSWSSQLENSRSSHCYCPDDQFPSTTSHCLRLRWPSTWDEGQSLDSNYTISLSNSLG